jgi:hypothetical protein
MIIQSDIDLVRLYPASQLRVTDRIISPLHLVHLILVEEPPYMIGHIASIVLHNKLLVVRGIARDGFSSTTNAFTQRMINIRSKINEIPLDARIARISLHDLSQKSVVVAFRNEYFLVDHRKNANIFPLDEVQSGTIIDILHGSRAVREIRNIGLLYFPLKVPK